MWKKQTLININYTNRALVIIINQSINQEISWFNKQIDQRIFKYNIYSNVKETNID